MINRILANLAEYITAGSALVIGGLVLALKIQGGRLHRAQLKLLDQELSSKLERDSSNTSNAQKRFSETLQAFLAAGGKMALTLALIMPFWAHGADLLPKCQDALGACIVVTQAQAQEIKDLKEASDRWKEEGMGAGNTHIPLILGAMASGSVSGVLGAPGGQKVAAGVTGGLIGLIIGWAIGGIIDK